MDHTEYYEVECIERKKLIDVLRILNDVIDQRLVLDQWRNDDILLIFDAVDKIREYLY